MNNPPLPPPCKAPAGRRWLTMAILLTAAVIILCQSISLTDASSRLDAFPLRGASFTSRNLAPDPATQTVMGNARMISRLCQTSTQRITLSIIDGTRNRHATHDPAYCLRGAGWEITAKEPVTIPGGEALKLKLAKLGKTAEALYWFSDGKNRHASAVSQWLQAAARRISFGKSGPAPLLLVVFPADEVAADWPTLWKEMPELWSL